MQVQIISYVDMFQAIMAACLITTCLIPFICKH